MVSRMSYEIILRDLVVNKNVANKYPGEEMLNEVRIIHVTRGEGKGKRFEAMRYCYLGRMEEKFLYTRINKAL